VTPKPALPGRDEALYRQKARNRPTGKPLSADSETEAKDASTGASQLRTLLGSAPMWLGFVAYPSLRQLCAERVLNTKGDTIELAPIRERGRRGSGGGVYRSCEPGVTESACISDRCSTVRPERIRIGHAHGDGPGDCRPGCEIPRALRPG
jgi:hypothetical protein